MPRNWDAEWAKIDAEYRTAHDGLIETHELVKPGPIAEGKTASTDDLKAFSEAHRRFEAAKARRTAFITERRASDPKGSV